MILIFIPLYIVVTLAIGFWASKRIRTTTDYMLAGRGLSTCFVGVTIFATWFGSSYLMGNPSYFMTNGFSSFVALIISGGICLTVVGYFYAKRLYQMNIAPVGDFLHSLQQKNENHYFGHHHLYLSTLDRGPVCGASLSVSIGSRYSS